MNANYITIFDAMERSPLETWTPVILGVMAIVFATALWFRRESMMPDRSDSGRVVVAALIIWASVGWTGLATYRIGKGALAIKSAVRENTLQALEGYVTRFKPQFGNGDFMEKFCVGTACFSYFDALPSIGFHRSGIVGANDLVKIWFTGNDIIRLEIVPRPKQQSAPPPPGAGTE